MPKHKKRAKNLRQQPTGLPSLADTNAAAHSQPPESPLFDLLEHQLPEQREQACNSLANIVLEEEGAVEVISTGRGARLLVQLVQNDGSQAVRLAAMGALHNLSIAGGPTAATLLVTLSLPAILLTILAKDNGQALAEEANLAESIQAIVLLCSMCESSELAVEQMLNNIIVTSLVTLFVNPTVSQELRIQGGELLQIITDGTEGHPVCDQLVPTNSTDSMGAALASLLNSTVAAPTQIRIIAATIIGNVGGWHRCPEFMRQAVLPLIAEALLFDPVPPLLQLSNSISAGNSNEDTQKALKIWQSDIATLTRCVEILANASVFQNEESRIVYIRQFIISDNIVERVAARCAIDINVLETIETSVPTLRSATDAVRTALLTNIRCLGNILMMLETNGEWAPKLWILLCSLSNSIATAQLWELLDATLSAMWTLLRNSVAAKAPITVGADVIEGIIQVARGGTPDLRLSAVGIIGCVGAQKQLAALADSIIDALLTVAQGAVTMQDATSVMLFAEALNAVFDVFGEDDLNSSLCRTSAIPRLQQLLGPTAVLMRQVVPHVDQDLAERLEETHANLAAFIAYKQPLINP